MKTESEIKFVLNPQIEEKKELRWKAFRPVLDAKKCEPACISVKLCPRKAIIIVNDKPKIDYNLCDGCLVCLRECTHGAILEEKVF